MQARGHRVFFALFPDRGMRRKIEAIHRTLDRAGGFRGRAVKVNQYHVTLAFLGNQPSERLARLLAIGEGLDMPKCSVTCDRIGRFYRAGVVWFGTSNPPAELQAFQASLCTALERACIPFDRKPWKFHVTLYRNLRTRCETIDFEPVTWRLNGFSLMESVSVDRGVEYRQLGYWKSGSSGDELQ